MTSTSSPLPISKQRSRAIVTLFVLPILLILVVILAVGIGAVQMTPLQVVSILLSPFGIPPLEDFSEQQKAVLFAIRLPRVVLGILVGAGLAIAGTAMQGLFRNPLADPGLLGISSGASLAVALSVVFGLQFFDEKYSLAIAAFMGALIATALIYILSQERGRVNVATMLLAGIAINALCGAGTGLMTFLATDEQLRTLIFWGLGSLNGAMWSSVTTASPLIIISIIALPLTARALNAFMLGESGAAHLGIPVQQIKWLIIALVALSVGASVAVSGAIGFVGLVVPHLLRLIIGPNHQTLIPASALLGAILLILADLVARTIAIPAEVPIGIITALIGGPFFLYLLQKGKKEVHF